ncbi:hypothetical protein ACU5EH_00685 [Aliivibrio salmonicida]|uniref:hypothetical protein n=1 Tax=Aliivibrio TaxID=511678 RepID=UPI0007C4A2A3|nr:hypothetical protein [Aliivibrio fischeri]
MYDFSEKVRKVFLQHRDVIELPFFHRFPINSCESASYFLGVLLANNFPDKDVVIVEGYEHKSDERHFWVEVDGQIIDITADQFPSVSKPIYGGSIHPLAKKFKSDSKIDAQKGFEKFDLIDATQKANVYKQVSFLIQQRT